MPQVALFGERIRELLARGALRGVRDVAAKAAGTAARRAALFHVLEHGASGTIASEEIRAAACIVGWHFNLETAVDRS